MLVDELFDFRSLACEFVEVVKTQAFEDSQQVQVYKHHQWRDAEVNQEETASVRKEVLEQTD